MEQLHWKLAAPADATQIPPNQRQQQQPLEFICIYFCLVGLANIGWGRESKLLLLLLLAFYGRAQPEFG